MSTIIKRGTKKPYRLPRPIGNETSFVWGPVVKIHSIEGLGIDIVEYYEEISRDDDGIKAKPTPSFHIYVNGQDASASSNSLEKALVHALAVRVHGSAGAFNGNHAYFALKCLGIE